MRLAVIISSVWLALCACSGGDSFSVTAKLDGQGVETIVMRFYDGEGLKTVDGHAEKAGAPVKLTGHSEQWTIVELRRGNGELIASFPACNGRKISVGADRDGNFSLKGFPEADSLSAFINRNHALIKRGPSEKLNAAIADYIKANPASIAATTLLLTRFDASGHPEQADSLFSLLKPEARPATLIAGWAEQLQQTHIDRLSRHVSPFSIHGTRDSLISFSAISTPYSVLAFIGSKRPDSLARTFGNLRREWPSKRLKLTEVWLSTDSARFTRAMEKDTARWTRGWVAGGAASPSLRRLAISSVPFFIVTDSTGRQIYRGPSLSSAASTLSTRK